MRAPFLLLIPLAIGGLSACEATSEDLWAVDAVWFEVDDTEIYGFQAWQVYDGQWARSRSQRHHLCSVVISFDGTQTTNCADCYTSWEIHSSLAESDCDADLLSTWDWMNVSKLGLSTTPTSSLPSQEELALVLWTQWRNNEEWTEHGWTHELPPNTFETQSPWAWKLSR